MQYSAQKWFCNACGSEQNSIPFSPGACWVVCAKYTCCSRKCADEMNWRYTLSVMGRSYYARENESEANPADGK